ncbi:MAG TPA: HEAT repeat domain-containing protein [Pseudomonadota bacterium]|nr:HEAT repeat domain-containing protein [Pseudomonadota bacterium]HNK44369.1 HEAT repeat domain-containing protein [Pseudomonadota bacterium]
MSVHNTAQARRCERCGELYPEEEKHTCGSQDEVKPVSSPSVPPPSAPDTTHSSNDDLIGTVIDGRFDILERLSAGGMGVVYRARHVLLDAEVAIKVLLKPQDQDAQYRFLQEAQLASKVKHPNTVVVSDFGVLPDDRSFLAMEFLRGPVLSKVISQGPLEPLRMCRIAVQIARGLQAVHDKGIIHRDLKPDNIFLVDQDGQKDFVKIVDFGIATNRATAVQVDLDMLSAEKLGAEAQRAMKERHTMPGMVLGTPQYMSPEQTQGFELDPRTDQYALGCIMYEMLTGVVPFDDASFLTVMFAQASAPVPPMGARAANLKIPESLERVVMRTLAKEPAARFPSMKALEEALQAEIDVLSPTGRQSQVQIQVVKKGWPLWALMATIWGTLLVVGASTLVGWVIYKRQKQAAHDESLAATTRLLEARQRAVEVLKNDLAAKAVELRVGALSGLAETRDGTLLPVLSPLLKDGELRVQVKAAEILGQLGRREASAQLAPLLGADGVAPLLQTAAAEALDLLGDVRGRQALKKTMASKGDQQAKLRATLYLCGTGDADARKLLTQAVAQGLLSETGQLEVLPLLSRAGDQNARSRLRLRLGGSGNVDQQRQVAMSLAKLSEPSGKQYLREQSKKPGLDGLIAAVLLAQLEESVDPALFRNVLNAPAATASMQVLAVTGLGYSGQRPDIELLQARIIPTEPPLQQAAATAIIRLTGADPQVLAMQDISLAERALQGGGGLLPEEALAILGEVGTGKQVGTLTRVLRDSTDLATRRGAVRALAKVRDRAALTALVSGLEDKDASVREEVIRALGEAGRRLIAQGQKDVLGEVKGWLGKVVTGPSGREQALARTTLLKLGDESQRTEVLGVLRSGDGDARRQVIESLDKDAATLSAALEDPEDQNRFLAARRLAELNDKRAIPVLRQTLADNPDSPEGILAYALLRRLNVQAEAPKKATELLDSSEPAVRAAAVQAAVEQDSATAALLLERAARDPDKQVRLAAVAEVARLTEGESRPLLRTLMRDRDPEVRAKATAVYQQQKAAAEKPPEPTDAAARPDAGAAQPDAAATQAVQKPDAVEDKPAQLEAIEKLVHAGASAFKDGSYDKARARLQQANALCGREAQKACAKFSWELGFYLGRSFEGDARYEQAMSEYQKLKSQRGLSKSQRKELSEATGRVQNKLALLTIIHNKKGRCVPEERWLGPGTHELQIKGSPAQTIELRARQKQVIREPGCT